MPWVQAKNIHAGEYIVTTNGVRKVLHSSKRGGEQKIVISDACRETVLLIPRAKKVSRMGLSAATMRSRSTR